MNKHVKNPLTLIAVFAGLAEVAATGVLPVLKEDVRNIFVWYVMLFPALLVSLFFWTLNRNHHVLYAPSDFEDEEHFMKTLSAVYISTTEESDILHRFWKPDGEINPGNEMRLKQWLRASEIESPSITFFLRNKQFGDVRKRAVAELGLSA